MLLLAHVPVEGVGGDDRGEDLEEHDWLPSLSASLRGYNQQESR